MPEEEFPVIKRWRALFEAGFKPRGYPNREERLKNPLNFFVNRYSLSSRSVTKEDKKAKLEEFIKNDEQEEKAKIKTARGKRFK